MALWMVRCGKYGERQEFNLENSIVSIGWGGLPDLKDLPDRASLAKLMTEGFPDEKPSAVSNWVGQVWTFAKLIQVGDLVAMPLKSTAAIQFGNVLADYEYRPDFIEGAQHVHKVQWLKNIPRTTIDSDLLFSFGAIQTVCKISRNDAEARLRSMLAGATKTPASAAALSDVPPVDEPDDETADSVDFEELLLDQIRTHIAQKFAGHALAELVEAVLQAQGFKTFLSPPGPDGGVDVLAGLGPHGFDETRLAVQVKSGGNEVDTNTYRQFRGVMKSFDANHGLIVSWGGFRAPVRREIPREYFNVRFWGADELIEALLKHYDALPASIQARLPLKRTWVLVLASDD